MKLGTPIGAGPKGAIVIVGLAEGRGAAGVERGRRRRRRSASGWSPPPVALGASTAPSGPLPPLASPRLSLTVAPPRRAWRVAAAIERPADAGPSRLVGPVRPSGRGRASARRPRRGWRLLAGPGRRGAVGSSRSTRPSLSSSRPLAQAGACSEGTAVVVVAGGSAGRCRPAGLLRPSPRPEPTPPGSWRARRSVRSWFSSQCASCLLPATRNAAAATVPSPSGRRANVPARPGARNGCAAPQQALNQQPSCLQRGSVSAVPDALVKLK